MISFPVAKVSVANAAQGVMDDLIANSGPTFMACYMMERCHSASEMREAARAATEFLAVTQTRHAEIATAAQCLSFDEVGRQVMLFVSAWPNASNGDLAGYGAQLLDDLLSEEPCRYALAESFRHLRRTSRFLPSIAEVLAELEKRQTRIRNTLAHIRGLPALIEKLEALAHRRERIDAERQARCRQSASAPAYTDTPP